MGIDDSDVTEHRKCQTDIVSSICCIVTVSVSIGDDFISKFVEIFIAFEEIDVMEICIFLLGDSQSIGWYMMRDFVFVLYEFIDNQIIQYIFLRDVVE